jgi:formylglycine-generating enzyme required for sulfatase activity
MKNAIIFVAVVCIGSAVLAACPTSDFSRDCRVNLEDFALMAGLWLVDYDPNDLAAMALEWQTEGIPTEPSVMAWVRINDPGFNGYMSKYETTNAQYCQYLNAAKATGDITASGNDAIGAHGSNGGSDYAGSLYYDGDGVGSNANGATNGGAARIKYSGGVFSVADPNFRNHPVSFITWYGATAFCSYYGFRLPTEGEWQAVADYDGTFDYPCGDIITTSLANYWGSYHPYGTTVVGAFETYGYGLCDMSGNIMEWTSSVHLTIYRVLRGGSWYHSYSYCGVSFRETIVPYASGYFTGFRACY